MSGIVFFMLVGRYFQGKTYSSLTFNRDYTSYFPLGVTVLDEQGNEKQVPVSDLQKGHRIKVHSGEIIPADCILFFGQAHIDYSFVTGESLPVDKSMGEIIYAGGKQTGGALEMEVVKEVSQSYLTQLWNNDAFRKKEEKNTSYIHRLSRYFTLVLFSVALTAGVYWQFTDPSRVWNAVTAVLIVACPCALLLSAAFTNGHMLRVLQKFGFYARNAGVIEKVSSIDTLVFDKTGTITRQEQAGIKYEGEALNPEIAQLIRSLASQSAHPLSKAIVQALPASVVLPVKHFQERPGYGITGRIGDHMVIIGSAAYTRAEHLIASRASGVYIKIDGRLYGKFSISIQYRKGLERLFAGLKKHFGLSLLSGDNDAERDNLKHLFSGQLLFGQSPQDKLNYIRSLQAQDHRVLMLGDGLNDAGALKQSDIGIAVTDNINNFSPACDVILAGSSFHLLDSLLWYCRKNKQIINSSFVVSILYNLCGLYFAVQGQLQPVIAAVLMPVSSISIVLLTTGMSSLFAMRLKKTQKTDVDHVLS
jgi:Cu+-exporting ATPase